jgi:XTP/dITP diphosphohydrolase
LENTVSQRSGFSLLDIRGEVVKKSALELHRLIGTSRFICRILKSMLKTLYVATGNHGKLRDFAAAAAVYGLSIAPLPNLPAISAPEEDGDTFEANARIKAEYYSTFAPDELVIADDSGLEVDALGGAPGVRSARYAEDAGFNASTGTLDERNNLYLLDRLSSHPAGNLTARYRCVIAAARNGKVLLTTDGSVEGEILKEPRGSGGFGYDPLFYLAPLKQTMAEVDLETKNSLSHRGKAFFKLLEEMRRNPL